MKSADHDAVVIGGGLGGLVAAAVLATQGRNVCVIERHEAVGGSASTYVADGLTIEAALHETADPNDPLDPKYHVFKRLGLLDSLEWVPVGPLYSARGGPLGDDPFEVGHGFDTVREAFRSRFGDNGMDRVLERMETIGGALREMMQMRMQPSVAHLARAIFGMRPLVSEWKYSLADVLDAELGGNEAAKCALAANIPYYGDDPAALWWIFFAVAQGSYIRLGGRFLKGGSGSLTTALAGIITRHGGAVMTGEEVVGVMPPHGNTPAEVECRDVKTGALATRTTRVVAANCAPHVLAGMLTEPARTAFFRRYDGKPVSTSLFNVHFGVRRQAADRLPKHYSSIVLPRWMTALSDYATAGALLSDMPRGNLPPFALVNYGIIDSGLGNGDPIPLTVTGVDRVANWAGLSREAELTRRAAWTDAIEAEIERHWPGFSAAVTVRRFVSAASMHRYLGTPDGAIYGFAPVPPTRPVWSGIGRSPKTALDGVFLASSYAGAGGYSGAIGTGAMAGDMADSWLRRRA